MALYESVIILDASLSDEDATALGEDIRRRYVDDADCEIGAVSEWGRRKLAYPINRATEGYYVVFRFTHDDSAGSPDFSEVERHLRFTEQVIRYVNVRLPENLKDTKILVPPEYRLPQPGMRRGRSGAPPARTAASPTAAEPTEAPVPAEPAEAPVAAEPAEAPVAAEPSEAPAPAEPEAGASDETPQPESTESTEPTDTADTADTTDSTDSTDSTESTEPTDSTDSTESTEPAEEKPDSAEAVPEEQ